MPPNSFDVNDGVSFSDLQKAGRLSKERRPRADGSRIMSAIARKREGLRARKRLKEAG